MTTPALGQGSLLSHYLVALTNQVWEVCEKAVTLEAAFLIASSPHLEGRDIRTCPDPPTRVYKTPPPPELGGRPECSR